VQCATLLDAGVFDSITDSQRDRIELDAADERQLGRNGHGRRDRTKAYHGIANEQFVRQQHGRVERDYNTDGERPERYFRDRDCKFQWDGNRFEQPRFGHADAAANAASSARRYVSARRVDGNSTVYPDGACAPDYRFR